MLSEKWASYMKEAIRPPESTQTKWANYMKRKAQLGDEAFDISEEKEIPQIEKAVEIVKAVLDKERAEGCPPEELNPLETALRSLEEFISVESADQAEEQTNANIIDLDNELV